MSGGVDCPETTIGVPHVRPIKYFEEMFEMKWTSLFAGLLVCSFCANTANADLFSFLKHGRNDCCEPAPADCCAPAPKCVLKCGAPPPAPKCCSPAPAPAPKCCAPAPVDCCKPKKKCLLNRLFNGLRKNNCCEPAPADCCDPCCKPKKKCLFGLLGG